MWQAILARVAVALPVIGSALLAVAQDIAGEAVYAVKRLKDMRYSVEEQRADGQRAIANRRRWYGWIPGVTVE